MMKRPLSLLLFAGAVGVAFTIAGCASPTETEAQREAATRQVEVCVTNTLIALVELETKREGTGKTSVKTLSPQETACIRSKSGALLAAEIRPGHETQAYAMRFENFFLSPPQGVLIVGPWQDSRALAPGTCEFLSEGEKLHLDSGTTRFEAVRLSDTDVERFKMVLSPTSSRNVPSQCQYMLGGPPM